MKLGLILFAVSASTAFASDWMTCKETQYSKETYSSSRHFSGDTIKIRVTGEDLDYIAVGEGKGSAVLDKRFKSPEKTRFVDTSYTLDYSDSGEVGLFLTKPVLRGKPGTLTITSNQANDGESGPKWLWGTAGIFYCK